MYASVTIVVETRRDALLVPTSALVVDKGGSAVFALVGNTAKRQIVKTGSTTARARRSSTDCDPTSR